jgi:hypothetical protein
MRIRNMFDEAVDCNTKEKNWKAIDEKSEYKPLPLG